MKQTIYILLLCIGVILASCSSRDELAQYVPGDAAYTAKINAENLIEKSGCKLEGNQIILSEAIKTMSESKIAQIPDAFDFSKDMYFFGNNDFTFCLILKITDVEVLNNEIFKIGEFRESKGFKIADLNFTDRICVKNDIAFCVSPNLRPRMTDDEILEKIDLLIENKGQNAETTKNLNGSEDLIVNLDIAEASKIKHELLQAKSFLKSVTLRINFEKEVITFKVNSDINETNPFIAQANDILTECNSDALKFFSKNINGIYGLGIDGKALNKSGLVDLITSMQPMLSIFPINDILENINGSIILGVHSAFASFPDEIVLAVESNDSKKLLEQIVSVNSSLFTHDGDVYAFALEPSFKLQAKDNYLIVSNANPDVENSIKENSDIKNTIDDAILAGYFSSEILKGSNTDLNNFNIDFDIFMKVKKLNEAEIDMKLRNVGSANSLQYIIENSKK